MPEFTTLPPLSLYIHIPWCIQKCPYCDFNSHAVRGELPENDYIDALIRDLDSELPAVWGRRLHSIFIGGGTPSLLSAASFDRLLSAIRARLPCSPDMEITLEANPGTFEQQKFSEFRETGINRLSIGIQSFDDDQLQTLGRVHNRDEALKAINMAQQAGFDNFNLDLMFGLPDQRVDDAINDLTTALSFSPTHLSYYQLTIEPNTLFYSQPPALPDSDRIWEMQHHGQQLLAEKGYEQYEVSAYARSGRQSQHNLNYWHFGDYLGIGAGAHGKVSRADTGTIRRTAKQRQPGAYLQHAGTPAAISSQRDLTEQELPLEFMLNALRLKHGFDRRLYSQHTGSSLQDAKVIIDEAVSKGLLTVENDWIKPSEQGFLFLNDLLAMFIAG